MTTPNTDTPSNSPDKNPDSKRGGIGISDLLASESLLRKLGLSLQDEFEVTHSRDQARANLSDRNALLQVRSILDDLADDPSVDRRSADWYCEQCNRGFKEWFSGEKFDGVIYCSDSCIENRKSDLG